MPVPLIKRGANQAGCLVAILHAGPPSQGVVNGTGQALQGDSLPDPAGRVGGEGTGGSTPGGVLHFLGGRMGMVDGYLRQKNRNLRMITRQITIYILLIIS
jgi:hypothetical protein